MRATSCVALSIFLAVAALAPQAAHADLTGDTVDASYIFPNSSTVFQDFGTFTVAGGGTFEGSITYQVTGTQVSFTYANGSDYQSAAFNGFRFTDLTESLAGYLVTLDAATNIAGYRTSNASISGNALSFNFEGLNIVQDGTVVYDISPVPEPSSLMLLGTGVLGAFGVARRRLFA